MRPLKNKRTATNLKGKLNAIRYLLLDVDGVLTDGKVYLGADGKEMKVFNIYDGHGMALLQKNGIQIGFLSARTSEAVHYRAVELGIKEVFQGVENKLERYEEILKRNHLENHHMAYMGDDLIDLPLMKRAGLGIAVANAVREVKSSAHYITQKPGGEGAVREVAEMILKGQGKWKHG